MDTYERGELASAILKTALVGGAITAVVVMPGLSSLLKTLNAGSSRERWRVRQSLNGMEKRGFIIRRVVNGKEQYVVTKKGKRRLVDALLEDLVIVPQKAWDKKWRIVMFDIPETKKDARDVISQKLNAIGMMTLQQSVFVTPYPCKEHIDAIAEHLGVHEHLVYIESSVVESTTDLLAHFDLA